MKDENQLLDEIKNSIADMQQQMQSTYSDLSKIKVSGKSHDNSVEIVMLATSDFDDIIFDQRALQGGIKDFKQRIREAWKSACSEVQKATQSKTMELLQGMQIPDEIKNLSVDQDDKSGSGGAEDAA